ncbi:MAG: DedA family protein [Candidatus Thermoplasmatota archaeon]
MAGVVDWINHGMIYMISSAGYLGIFLAMFIEGILTPIPSELVMPFAGYLSSPQGGGELNFLLVILVGSLGAAAGSTVAYALARLVGRPLVTRYGRYFMIRQEHIERADGWFERWGDWGIFIGHSLPGVRSFISFPAGIAKMRPLRFVVFTFFGAMVWNTVLVTSGYLLGEYWMQFWKGMGWLDIFMFCTAVAVILGYLYCRKRSAKYEVAGE